ncbi:TonB-dependent siderophore receptor [Hymenobacter sp. UV11]|uniref:TonB-dependent receptor n=1 Tax=Hymenobacter sp. UV11 TaxID=1849735 RepID=UPI00105CB50B|nr:TonB-dependent receptor [Hymenobacter sp. UV11]TDN38199.1 TonB-dependent receptor [Hymenobacter sp. UV11]TFZ67628.1 TonB-dependent siderophore receptor [Hymenobacter sp. UV11]
MRHFFFPFLLISVALPVFSQGQGLPIPAAAGRAHQRTGTIRGIVRTSDGQPAAFVSVGLPKLGKGANTAEDGSFTIVGVEPGEQELQVSYVGLQPQRQTVTVAAGQTAKADFALSESAADLSEVIVTGTTTINRLASASKADIAPLDQPQSVGVVTHTVIADQQINRLGDALRNVSGVSLTQQRGGVAETFSARGYSIGIGGGGGSIFKNGLLTNTQGIPDASTLESVEVLKGAAALLYGNVSGGLIINTVTKKPRYEWGGSVEMRAGSYNFYKPIVDVYGPLTKNLAFRVVGTYENAQSYRDVVTSKRLYVNPSLLYKFGAKTDLLVQGDYLRSDITPDAGVGIINLNTESRLLPNTPRSRFINAPWAYNVTDQATGSAVLTHHFSDAWRLSAIAGVADTRVHGFGLAVPNNAIAANGDYTRTLGAVNTSERDWNAQLNLNGKFTTGFLGHQLLVGGDALRITTTSTTFKYQDATGKIGSGYGVINLLDPTKYGARTDVPGIIDTARTTSPSYRFGGYVQDLIAISPKFKVLGGVRYSYQTTQQTSIANYDKQQTRHGAADKIDQAWSPKGALIFQPLPTLSLYASYANNFIVNTGTDIYGQNLSPSLVNQYEAGVKTELFGSRLFANAAVYRYLNNNFAQTAPYDRFGNPNAVTTVKELTGETTSDGADVDISGSFSQNFYFNAGYAYNFARYTNAGTATGSPINGERLTNNPAHTANASIFYTFDRPGLRGLKLGASAFYTGQRLGGNNNTVGQAGSYSRTISLSGFTTVDLSAGYAYQHFSILFKLSNITDELNYLVHDRYSINPIPPRQFLTTVGYRF